MHCGALNQGEIDWWKRLWFHGLGEFFYRNKIETTINDFVQFECHSASPVKLEMPHFQSGGLSLVPVGGGKDSCVTMQLLQNLGRPFLGFTVNDQPARTETFAASGGKSEQLLRTTRSIDPALLSRNAEGFWNGHTPFSAIVAFLGLFCAYLVGADDLVLSNEASANEASIPGTEINHQYSKSFAFERDMNNYITERFGIPIRYFSLLRPFNELQITRKFSSLPQYHTAFKSCNIGSKQNIWCGHCAKCLFVYLMLAPFLSQNEMHNIFGADLLHAPELADDLCDLLGQTEAKPFECVGTISEARAALAFTQGSSDATQRLLQERNEEHHVPQRYAQAIERMYADVNIPVPLSFE